MGALSKWVSQRERVVDHSLLSAYKNKKRRTTPPWLGATLSSRKFYLYFTFTDFVEWYFFCAHELKRMEIYFMKLPLLALNSSTVLK